MEETLKPDRRPTAKNWHRRLVFRYIGVHNHTGSDSHIIKRHQKISDITYTFANVTVQLLGMTVVTREFLTGSSPQYQRVSTGLEV